MTIGNTNAGGRAFAIPLDRRLPGRVKFFFGFGAIAFGVKDLSFALILTFYFNQVIGVDAAIVGTALFCALVLDAFIDPLIGHLSDNLRTRWGRRHPFLYASAVPAALAYLLLWFPPDPDGANMFLFIFGVAFLVRATMSCFEVPMASLGPELTSDYHERTRLFGLRFFFAWLGGASMLLLAFAVLLPAYPGNQLDPRGYHDFAIIAAIVMALAIALSALGTHSEIKYLPTVEREELTLGQSFGNVFGSLSNRAFLILMLCTLFANAAQGLNFGLLIYFITHFWELGSQALAWFMIAQVVGIGFAVFASSWLSRRIGKRRAAVRFLLLAIVAVPLPYLARIAGYFPDNGDPMLLPLLVILAGLGSSMLVSALILKVSMLTDVIEDDAEKTGRRSEGIFFAGQFFVQKCVSGLGIALTATVLAIAAFPSEAEPGTVSADVLQSLAICFAVVIIGFGLFAAAIVSRFPIDQKDHEDRIARMRGTAQETTL
ncbi:MAG: MFS transporter [Parasphingopyxis sp.]|uniref:MFS transporter n=1 Tax=Parasphingopyxis sp. TaxID=1920299 RepID=UPI0032EDCDB8